MIEVYCCDYCGNAGSILAGIATGLASNWIQEVLNARIRSRRRRIVSNMVIAGLLVASMFARVSDDYSVDVSGR